MALLSALEVSEHMERKKAIPWDELDWQDKGGQFEAAVMPGLRWLNQDMTRARVIVWVRERKLTGPIPGKLYKGTPVRRVGDCRMMGNFSPIWVNWRGKSIQLEQLLKIGW